MIKSFDNFFNSGICKTQFPVINKLIGGEFAKGGIYAIIGNIKISNKETILNKLFKTSEIETVRKSAYFSRDAYNQFAVIDKDKITIKSMRSTIDDVLNEKQCDETIIFEIALDGTLKYMEEYLNRYLKKYEFNSVLCFRKNNVNQMERMLTLFSPTEKKRAKVDFDQKL